MLRLDTEVQFVKGVGPRRSTLLHARGIRTVGDLLIRIPRAYQDRASFVRLDSLHPGEDAAIHARIYQSRMIPTRSRGGIFHAVLTDGTSFVHAKWFHGGYLHQGRAFSAGREVVMYGRVELDTRDRNFVFFNPEFEFLEESADKESESLDIGRIVPIYEEIGGLTSRQLRRIISAALSDLEGAIDDPLPETLRATHGFPDLRTCLTLVHFPLKTENITALNRRDSPYHRRLIFQEFFQLELVLASRRIATQRASGIRFETNDAIRKQVKQILPFHPTNAQKRVLKEIVDDLKSPYPMNRLMQGDVGSGKTIVAFEAMVIAIANGYQAAIMAPTEILAEQHYWNAKRILAPLQYSIGVLRRGIRTAEKVDLFKRLAAGDIQLVVGTHALIEEKAEFRNLGLVVIDEQHRFGVLQRQRLMGKSASAAKLNTLVMTATPIPRTLAMSIYGDLDLSVIDEMPPGRTPIQTIHVSESGAAKTWRMIDEELSRGRQCYVVYPLIEESEKIDLRSATEGLEKLKHIFPKRRLALLHGRMKSDEKDAVMRAFSSGAIDILVSTTVIEVGVDVANATVMLIQHADRFGLAQLHQLRGRVGRGTHRSTCILMTSARMGETARERIQAMVATTDGFRLAEVDLRLRGPGELAGTRQSGIPEFHAANLMEDSALLALAQQEARKWVEGHGDCGKLMEALAAHSTGGRAGLATVG